MKPNIFQIFLISLQLMGLMSCEQVSFGEENFKKASKEFKEFVAKNIDFSNCPDESFSHRAYQCLPEINGTQVELNWKLASQNTCHFLTATSTGKVYGSPNINQASRCIMALEISNKESSTIYQKEIKFLEGQSLFGSGFKVAGHYQNYVYFGRSGQLEIWNISDINQPQYEGVTNTIPDPYDAIIHGEYLIVAGTIGGAYIHSLKNPSSPKLVSTTPYKGIVQGIKTKSNYAFLAHDILGVGIVEITNPEKPLPVSLINLEKKVYDVEIQGNYLYATIEKTGLAVIDISKLSNPKLIKVIPITGDAQRISKHSHFLYISNGSAGLEIFNINNNSDPVKVTTSTNFGTVTDTVIYDDKLLVVRSSSSTTQLYNIQLDGSLELNTASITIKKAIRGYVSNDFLIIPSEAEGAGIFNKDTFSPLASFEEEPHISREISVHQNILASSAVNNFVLMDISDTLNPSQLHKGSLTGASDIEIVGNQLYVSFNAGVRVFNITDPQNPVVISTLTTTATKYFTIKNNLMALTLNNRSVVLIDISDPSNLVIRNTITNVSTPNKTFIDGNLLHIATDKNTAVSPTQESGLYTFYIADPENPQLLNHFQTEAGLRSLTIKNQYAFLAATASGLIITDISIPQSPSVITEVTGINGQDVFIDNNDLYISSAYAGIRRMNIQNIQSPFIDVTFYAADHMYSAQQNDTHLFLASYRSGIHIVKK